MDLLQILQILFLIGRIIVGGYFLMAGFSHFKNADMMAGYAKAKGTPSAKLAILGTGVLLVLGLLTSLAAAAVISVMLIAGLLAHRKNGFFVFKDGYEYVLVIAAACAALGALGPGRLSVDSAASIAVTGWDGFGVAVGRRRGGGRRPARHLLPPEGRLTGQLGGGCGDGFVVGLGVTLTCWE